MGNLLALGVMLCGGYFLIKLKAFYIFHPLRCMRLSLCVLKDKESFRSFALALAGTLGVGNILGVCVGIELGGAGALLWIFVSGFFSSVIKYCEVVVSKDSSFRDNDGAHGGFHYAIRTCLTDGRGGALATLYSTSLVLLSLLMGAALQSSAVIGSTAEFFDTPPAFISVFFTVAVLLGIVGGARRIEKITSFIIPPDAEYASYFNLKTLSFLFATLAVICALKNIKFFTVLAEKIVSLTGNLRSATIALVYITFIGSMIIANDMALITFLPLGYYVLFCTKN